VTQRFGRFAVAFAALLLGGCAANVRALSQEELRAFEALQERLEKNEGALDAMLDDLAKIDADVLTSRDALDASLAQAKLLERMNAPWASPGDPQLVATQKEVALYHLYALSEARAEVLQAKIDARHESLAQVCKAYGKMLVLTKRMIAAEKVILEHLEQPSSATVLSFVSQLASEARAFSSALKSSDNPKLKELAADVEAAADRLDQARDAAQKAADEIGRLGRREAVEGAP